MPADENGPRSINRHFVEVQDFTAAALGGEDDGKTDLAITAKSETNLAEMPWSVKYKIAPERLLYALQWLHNRTPPDFQLQAVRDPQLLFDGVATMLLAELAKQAACQDGPPPGGACPSGRARQTHGRAS
jgi:hypothetical protein